MWSWYLESSAVVGSAEGFAFNESEDFDLQEIRDAKLRKCKTFVLKSGIKGSHHWQSYFNIEVCDSRLTVISTWIKLSVAIQSFVLEVSICSAAYVLGFTPIIIKILDGTKIDQYFSPRTNMNRILKSVSSQKIANVRRLLLCESLRIQFTWNRVFFSSF